MNWTPTVCLYHGSCIDGFTAAWAVWRRWDDDVRMVPMHYGAPLPPLTPQDNVLMVDFSLKRAEMADLESSVNSVVVLDHHKTAEAELVDWAADLHLDDQLFQDIQTGKLKGCAAFFDMNKSGAMLAWEFCFPGAWVPPIIKLVQDRDLWKFEFEHTKALHRYLSSCRQTFADWNRAFENFESACELGKVLLDDHNKKCLEAAQRWHEKKIGGALVPAVNVPYFMASDCCALLLQQHVTAPFVAAYSTDGKSVSYSLRSEDSRVDVSEVARKYGGGGHRNASGFSVPA